jgi:hypothetical protein
MTTDAPRLRRPDNGSVAARSSGLLASLRRAQPQSAPSGWSLALDAAVAVGVAAVAVFEVAERTTHERIMAPNGAILISTAHPHAAPTVLVAAALTALPLAIGQVYPIAVWFAIVAAIVVVQPSTVPPVAFGTAVFAAYSAVAHSRYRNLAIASVTVVTLAVTATYADTLPRFPNRLSALFAIIPAAAACLGIRGLRALVQAPARAGVGGGSTTPRRGCAGPRQSRRRRPTAPSTLSGPASPASCTTSSRTT